jgi:queuosine precursor transporter
VVEFFGLFKQSVGIILWPVVFLLTDLINEHYGKQGVRKLTYITVGLIAYMFIVLSISLKIPTIDGSPVDDKSFVTVFGQGQWIIIGSITAFLISQLVDVSVFWMLRNRTGNKHIWLRATGSTVVSQLIDTFVVQFIAFVIPDKWTMEEFAHNALWGYLFKLVVALCLIPMIYVGHYIINKFLRDSKSTN